MLTTFLSFLGILSSSIFIVDNLMHSVLLLILTFLTSSLILFLMKIDFLGFAFIIIYVGAIAILFLFVIMMINIKNVENASPGGLKFFIVVCSCAGLFFNQWSFFFYSQEFFFFNLSIYTFFDSFSSFFYLSHLLYSFYTFSFLIAGLILLVAMIGAILLTMDFSSTNSSQIVSKQNSRATLVSVFSPQKSSESRLKNLFRAYFFAAYRHLLRNFGGVTYNQANFKVTCIKMRAYNKRQPTADVYLSSLLLLTIFLTITAGILHTKGFLDTMLATQIIVNFKFIGALLIVWQMLIYARFLYKDLLVNPDFYASPEGKLVLHFNIIKIVVRSITTLICGVVLISLHTLLQASETARVAAEALADAAEASAAQAIADLAAEQLVVNKKLAQDEALINSLEMELRDLRKPRADE